MGAHVRSRVIAKLHARAAIVSSPAGFKLQTAEREVCVAPALH